MLRKRKRLTTILGFVGAVLASFVGGAILEAFKPIVGPWLPWAPGGLTVAIQHNTAQKPLLAAGEVSRLVLKRNGKDVADVDSPQTAFYTFCKLRPGPYSVWAWANDMLSVKDCRIDVKSDQTAALACTVGPQAELRVEVLDKRSAAVVNDVSVRVRSHKGKVWREERVNSSGVSPYLFLQPTTVDTESYVVEIVRSGNVIATQASIRLRSGQVILRVAV
jgi:hypothetical protein